MREILFRGKLIFKDEWTEGSLIIDEYGRYYIGKAVMTNATTEYLFSGGRQNGKVFSRFFGFGFRMVIPETVGQYTGLTDKNGKKIFEGDIIKSCEYDEVYCVKYFADDNYPAFDVVPEMNITCNGLSHLHIVEGIEIIGNIHDNPELLKCEV